MSGTLDPKLEVKLTALAQRAEELSRTLAEPDITSDLERFRSVSRAYAELQPIIEKFQEYRRVEHDLVGARDLQNSEKEDRALRDLAGEEIKTLEARLRALESEVRVVLLPDDPNDAKNVVQFDNWSTRCLC